jgi:hypothetical protein
MNSANLSTHYGSIGRLCLLSKHCSTGSLLPCPCAPNSKRSLRPVHGNAAVQTCLTMKVFFGRVLLQTAGFVESLPGLTGPNQTLPDFSTLSLRQNRLAMKITDQGLTGPLQLQIDHAKFKGKGE